MFSLDFYSQMYSVKLSTFLCWDMLDGNLKSAGPRGAMWLFRLKFCPGSESHIVSLWKTLQCMLEVRNWVGSRDNVRRGNSACACNTVSSKMLERKYISSGIGDLKKPMASLRKRTVLPGMVMQTWNPRTVMISRPACTI